MRHPVGGPTHYLVVNDKQDELANLHTTIGRNNVNNMKFRKKTFWGFIIKKIGPLA